MLVAGTVAWLGRRDVTRPAVAFGMTWFAFVALAQLRLTEIEQEWSDSFTAVVFGGGLAFVIAAVLAAGTTPARAHVDVDRERLRPNRLIVAAVVLIAAGAAGAAYKADALGGIPLLSDDPDVVRSRALNGAVDLPAWSSALTGGFYLGMWCALLALWAHERRTPTLRVALVLLALTGLFGVSLDASRNLVVFAVAVPVLAAYVLMTPGGRRRQAAWAATAIAVIAVGVGGLFVVRLFAAESGSRAYVEDQLDRQPPLLRPLVPVYLNGVYPLEAARRVHEAVPDQYEYGLGANSLSSLPQRAFPEGKAEYGRNVATLMGQGATQRRLSWSVASYQGRLSADVGWRGVMLGSILLGLAFGAVYRWSRGRRGLVPVALIAYVAYYSAFLIYDNHLSFSIIAFYDLAVVAGVDAYVRGRFDRPIRVLREEFGRPSPA